MRWINLCRWLTLERTRHTYGWKFPKRLEEPATQEEMSAWSLGNYERLVGEWAAIWLMVGGVARSPRLLDHSAVGPPARDSFRGSDPDRSPLGARVFPRDLYTVAHRPPPPELITRAVARETLLLQQWVLAVQ